MNAHNCNATIERAWQQLDNKRPVSEIQAELAACPACLAAFERERELDQLLRFTPFAPLGRDLTAQVVAAVEQRNLRERRLLELGLLIGSSLSFVPMMLFVLGIVLIAVWQPGLLNAVVTFSVNLASTVQAILLAATTLFSTLSPWLLPTLAVLGLLSLVLAGLWGAQVAPRTRPVKY